MPHIGNIAKQELHRILFVPDTHRPYHDKKAWALFIKAARAFKPDYIVVLGDFADFCCVSSHDKDPSRTMFLDDEVADVKRGLAELDAIGASKKIYVAGNHEDRLSRYLMTKAPELFKSVKIPEVLGLDKAGWRYVAYKDSVQIGRLYVTHDTGRAGRHAHAQSMDDFQDNVVIGHTHRIGYGVCGNAKGRPHVGAMFGWLGDFATVDYMHRVKANRDWAHGFGIGYLQPRTGYVHLVPVPIVEGTCVIEGTLISL